MVTAASRRLPPGGRNEPPRRRVVLGLEVPSGWGVLSRAAAAASLQAGVAQLVEQLIRNQQVIGSSPIAGSSFLSRFRRLRYPEPPPLNVDSLERLVVFAASTASICRAACASVAKQRENATAPNVLGIL